MPEEKEPPTHLFVRTRRKGTEFHGDLHTFTDKWSDPIPVGEIRAAYFTEPNLEVAEDKKHAKSTEITGEPEEPVSP